MSFTKAQKLFSEYEKGKKIGVLRECLELLYTIITCDNNETNKAKNLRRVVLKYIEEEIDIIIKTNNLKEFAKEKMEWPEIAKLLSNSLTQVEAERFMHLIEIKTRYQ